MTDLQDQIDALVRQLKATRDDINDLQGRTGAAEARADASQSRADAAEARTDASELRTDALETQALIDRDMIAELQRDGVLSREHAAQMEEALRSSRTIGAAIGIIMGSRQVTDEEAFKILQIASQHSNRKLRDLAADLVATGVEPSAAS